MLIEAGRLGCTREVLVIVAALSMQDPRERPADRQAQADQSHARFRDEHSDFVSLLNLWSYLRDQQKSLSHSAFRRMCRTEFLHYLRVREWQDLHSQLRKACQDVGIDPRLATAAGGEPPQADVVHQALLSGLLSHGSGHQLTRAVTVGEDGHAVEDMTVLRMLESSAQSNRSV